MSQVQHGEMDIFVISKLVRVTPIINGLTGATLSMGLMADWFGIYRRQWYLNKNVHEYIKSKENLIKSLLCGETEMDNIGLNCCNNIMSIVQNYKLRNITNSKQESLLCLLPFSYEVMLAFELAAETHRTIQ